MCVRDFGDLHWTKVCCWSATENVGGELHPSGCDRDVSQPHLQFFTKTPTHCMALDESLRSDLIQHFSTWQQGEVSVKGDT